MDFVADTLEVLAKLGLLLQFIPIQGVRIFFLPDFLLLVSNLKSSQILLKLTLIDSILILNVLDRYLRFLFQLSKFIKILEE